MLAVLAEMSGDALHGLLYAGNLRAVLQEDVPSLGGELKHLVRLLSGHG